MKKEGKEACVVSCSAPHRGVRGGNCALCIIIKKEDSRLLLNPLLGGDYLRLPMSLTIGVVGLRALFQAMGRDGDFALRFAHYALCIVYYALLCITIKKETQERIPGSP